MPRVRIPVVPTNLETTGSVRLVGMREYALKLQQLGDGMIERGCVVALAVGVNEMRDAVKARAPVLRVADARRRPGVVRNAVQALRSRLTRFAVTYVVGVRQLTSGRVRQFTRRTGKRSSENPDDPWYANILEYGKSKRTHHPFIRPAFSASAPRAVQISFNRLRSFTESEIHRIAARP